MRAGARPRGRAGRTRPGRPQPEPAAPVPLVRAKPQAVDLSPRAVAPEKRVDLSALRELANDSASRRSTGTPGA